MATATPGGVDTNPPIRRVRPSLWFLLATVVTIVSLAGEASADQKPPPPTLPAQADGADGAGRTDGEAPPPAQVTQPTPPANGANRRRGVAPGGEVAPSNPAARHSKERPTAAAKAPQPQGPARAAEPNLESARPAPPVDAPARRRLPGAAVATPGGSPEAGGAPIPDRTGGRAAPAPAAPAQPSGSGLDPGADDTGTTSTAGGSPATTSPTVRTLDPDLSLGSGAPDTSPPAPGSPSSFSGAPGPALAGPRLPFAAPVEGLPGISLTRQLPARPGAPSVAEGTAVAGGSPASGGTPGTGDIEGWTGPSNGGPARPAAIATGAPSRSPGRVGSPNQIEPGSATAPVVALVLLIQAAILVARCNAAPSRRRLVAVAASGQLRSNSVMGAVSGAGPPSRAHHAIRSVSIDPSGVARIEPPTTARAMTITSTTSSGLGASGATLEPLQLSRGTETASNSSYGFHLPSAVVPGERAPLPRPIDQLARAAWPRMGQRWPLPHRGADPAEPGTTTCRERAPPLFGTSRLPLSCHGRVPPGRRAEGTDSTRQGTSNTGTADGGATRSNSRCDEQQKEKHDQCTSHRGR